MWSRQPKWNTSYISGKGGLETTSEGKSRKEVLLQERELTPALLKFVVNQHVPTKAQRLLRNHKLERFERGSGRGRYFCSGGDGVAGEGAHRLEVTYLPTSAIPLAKEKQTARNVQRVRGREGGEGALACQRRANTTDSCMT